MNTKAPPRHNTEHHRSAIKVSFVKVQNTLIFQNQYQFSAIVDGKQKEKNRQRYSSHATEDRRMATQITKRKQYSVNEKYCTSSEARKIINQCLR